MKILNVGSKKFLEEIIKPALERMARNKKAISVSDFEKLADKNPPKIS